MNIKNVFLLIAILTCFLLYSFSLPLNAYYLVEEQIVNNRMQVNQVSNGDYFEIMHPAVNICHLFLRPFSVNVWEFEEGEEVVFSWSNQSDENGYYKLEIWDITNPGPVFLQEHGIQDTKFALKKSQFEPGINYRGLITAYQGGDEIGRSIYFSFNLENLATGPGAGTRKPPVQTELPEPLDTLDSPDSPEAPDSNPSESVNLPPSEGSPDYISEQFGVDIRSSEGISFSEGQIRLIGTILHALQPDESLKARLDNAISSITAGPRQPLEEGRRLLGKVDFYSGAIVIFDSDTPLFWVLVHEIGHLTHSSRVNDFNADFYEFRKLHYESADQDFVSEHATVDWMEDWAEIFYMYMRNSEKLTSLARLRPNLAGKLKEVIKFFQIDDKIYTYNYKGGVNLEVELVNLGDDGLPEF